jgi:hypothetical protein
MDAYISDYKFVKAEFGEKNETNVFDLPPMPHNYYYMVFASA